MQHRHLQKRHVQCERQKYKEGEVAPVRLCKMNAALFQVFQSKRNQRQRTEQYALDRHLHGRERAAEGLERDLGRRIEHGRQQNIEPVGGAGSSLVETGWQLTEVEMEKLGSDVLITGLVPELDKQELPKEAE